MSGPWAAARREAETPPSAPRDYLETPVRRIVYVKLVALDRRVLGPAKGECATGPELRRARTSVLGVNVNVPLARFAASSSTQYLMNLYQDRLEIQGDALAKPYFGKWIKVNGTVHNVYQTCVLLDVNKEYWSRADLYFDDKWRDRLQLLQKAQPLSAIGQIQRISLFEVTLRECELLDNV
jgi:hypothetical protein